MTLYKLLFIVGLGYTLIFSTCTHGDLRSVSLPEYTFYIRNNTMDTFKYSSSTLFPDTTLQNNVDSTSIYPFQLGQINIPQYLLPNFETYGSVEVFLINVDTLHKYPWQTVASRYLIAKRYELTYDSIKDNNNVINYP
jgi:hypothetical protein